MRFNNLLYCQFIQTESNLTFSIELHFAGTLQNENNPQMNCTMERAQYELHLVLSNRQLLPVLSLIEQFSPLTMN